MILAIESTCDETGAAVVKKRRGMAEVLSNEIASSSEMHVKYGGIVPEVAAREQVKVIGTVIFEAMQKAEVSWDEIEAVAVAYGPGLMGSLLVGVETAKALAYINKKPLLAVNHMEAHVLANWIGQEPKLPAVGLVVSGGHTDLIYIKSINDWTWLGGTRDDAAGECFDKCARALGLPYPGGPSIQKAAEGASGSATKLPRPLRDDSGFEMSFSGLKAAVAREVGTGGVDEDKRANLAKEVNEAIVESLVTKTMAAVNEKTPRSVLLAGGVAASKLLREELEKMTKRMGIRLYMPEFKFCTDNAAMIGAAAMLRPKKVSLFELRPEPGLEVI